MSVGLPSLGSSFHPGDFAFVSGLQTLRSEPEMVYDGILKTNTNTNIWYLTISDTKFLLAGQRLASLNHGSQAQNIQLL